ncbi:MAG: hypothetical protein AAF664_22370 [Planctomycetota bacterium]
MTISKSLVVHAVGFVLATIYLAAAQLSHRFALGQPHLERPILLTLGLFALATAIYLSICFGLKRLQFAGSMKAFFLWGCLFRLILIPSTPILEIDIYRYVWDGIATSEGISPFRYPPIAITDAIETNSDDPSLQSLASVASNDPGVEQILRQVHYPELTTVYPPVSQAVFAAAAVTTLDKASPSARLVVMKSWIVAFDLFTWGIIILMLKEANLPINMSIIYGWCPLVLKEFSNSGHLDSIAVAFSCAAMLFVIKATKDVKAKKIQLPLIDAFAASTFFGLAIGAKLFPIIWTPLVAFVFWRRIGFAKASLCVATIIGLSALFVLPMTDYANLSDNRGETTSTPTSDDTDFVDLAPPQPDTDEGLKTFLTQWEMNDLIFLAVVENVRPSSSPNSPPWFVITSNTFRQKLNDRIAILFGTDIPFRFTRLLTGMMFVAIAFVIAIRASKATEAKTLLESTFLTVAWFWLLCPTQNPWYWTWALAFLPFATNRIWWLVSAALWLYYTRFWFQTHYTGQTVWNTSYAGTDFFDFVIPWIEFGPILVMLMLNWLFRNYSAYFAGFAKNISRCLSPGNKYNLSL